MFEKVAESLIEVIGCGSSGLGKLQKDLIVTDLFDIEDFEFCLELPQAFSTLRIAKDGKDINAYELAGRHGIRLSKLLGYIADGHSCIVHGLEDKLPSIRSLCKVLERQLDRPVSCNGYLTPGGGTAFPPHTDPHDVLVLQIIGTKLWHYGKDKATECQYRMTPGDILFLSKGVIHHANQQAESDDLFSLHITFAISEENPGSIRAEVARLMYRDTKDEAISGIDRYNMLLIGAREIDLMYSEGKATEETARQLLGNAIENLRIRSIERRISNLDGGIKSILKMKRSGGLDYSSVLRVTNLPFEVTESSDELQIFIKELVVRLPFRQRILVDLLKAKKSFCINELQVVDGREELLVACQLLAARGIIALAND